MVRYKVVVKSSSQSNKIVKQQEEINIRLPAIPLSSPFSPRLWSPDWLSVCCVQTLSKLLV